MRPKKEDKNISQNYKPIGIIKGWDFDGCFISNDGSKVLNRKKKEVTISFHGGYGKLYLTDTNKEKHGLYLSKIINQVLKGGKYEEEVDHINEVICDNSPENLEAVSHKENMIRCLGKTVKQIDIKTGNFVV